MSESCFKGLIKKEKGLQMKNLQSHLFVQCDGKTMASNHQCCFLSNFLDKRECTIVPFHSFIYNED